MDAIVFDAVSKKNFQIQKFTTGGTFTAKVTGVHFINGCGGGASGGAASASNALGGGAGAGCKMFPVFLTKGQSVTVTIGAGGVWVSGTSGANGGYTSFGSYLILPGGAYYGGLNSASSSATTDATIGDARPIGFLIAGANSGQVESGRSNGRNSTYLGGTGATNSSYYLTGGGGGFYGAGGNGNNAGIGQSAAANSGAGGGAGTTGGGTGGSGYLEVIYFI